MSFFLGKENKISPNWLFHGLSGSMNEFHIVCVAADEEDPREPSSECDLPVKILNPPGSLSIAYFSEVPLGGGEIGVAKNDFA